MAKKVRSMNKLAKVYNQPTDQSTNQSAGMSESYKAEFAAEHNAPNLKKKSNANEKENDSE